MLQLREQIRQAGLDLGFARIGFASAGRLPRGDVLARWLDRGMAGDMDYLARGPRDDPRRLMPEARVALVAVASYAAPDDPEPGPGQGLLARYARGQDYHVVLRRKLEALRLRACELAGREVAARAAVDTSPLLERELAMAAGVGFIGKNTMLITPGVGSYTVLGVLLLDLDLPPDAPAQARCGRCELCLEACPSRALVEPWCLDSRRCISYLTIEHRGEVPAQLRPFFAPWVFGCDACQEACPHNPRAAHKGLALEELVPPAQGAGLLDLDALLGLRSGAYRRLVRGRALNRVPRRMWQRNAALVAGLEVDDAP